MRVGSLADVVLKCERFPDLAIIALVSPAVVPSDNVGGGPSHPRQPHLLLFRGQGLPKAHPDKVENYFVAGELKANVPGDVYDERIFPSA